MDIPSLAPAFAPTAWTAGVLGAAAFLLYAVGGVLDHTDMLLLVLGAAPVAGFGMVAFGWPAR